MLSHVISFFLGFILDLIIGDPHWLPHPVCAIGKLIAFYENLMIGTKENPKNRSDGNKQFRGFIIVVLMVFSVEIPIIIVLSIFKTMCPDFIYILIEAIMTYQMLATKSLKVESMKVYKKIADRDLEGARKAVSMIVGRDTENLSEEGVIKAAVETVAENTSDGIIAPMFYLALGGPMLGFFYKTINTMDSMIGYKNERYLNFGFHAAKLDDALNFIPSRLSAALMLLYCRIRGSSFDFKNAKKIFLRDRYNHESPNSAQTESVCAGALDVQLAGPATYEGVLEQKPFIGDPIRKVENEDIKKANELLYGSAFLGMFFWLLIFFALFMTLHFSGAI